MNFTQMHTRSRIINGIRNFFHDRNYLEVDTPLLTPALIPEAPIEIFETVFTSDEYGSFPLYLIPSPEVHMKKLIASGSGNIFQITRSFRNSEQLGSHHNPEFSMLEWYTIDADYLNSIATTEELIQSLAGPEAPASIRPPFRKITVRKAFLDYAGFDLTETQDKPALVQAARKLGLSIQPEEDTWEQIYHRIFLSYVEPNLPSDQPLVLTDFPRQITCLAKEIPGTPWRERWELYINGIELANCYSEETDPAKIESFFRREYALKAAESRVVPDIDEEFIEIHRSGFPTCSGVALGVDRLIMALSGQASIEGVIFFPLSDTIRP